MLKNLGIKGKLVCLCAILSCFQLAVSLASYLTLHRVEKSYRQVAAVSLPGILHLEAMQEEYVRVRLNYTRMSLPSIPANQQEQAIEQTHRSMEKFEQEKKAYLAVDFMPGEKELYDPVIERWNQFKPMVEDAIKITTANDPQKNEKLADIYFKKGAALSNEFDEAIDKLIEYHKKSSEQFVNAAEDEAKKGNIFQLILAVVGVCVAQGIGQIFASALSKSLSNIAEQLGHGADEVTSASQQISGSSEKLSQSATEQASALQETAASVEEMSAMIGKNAENAAQSREVAVTSESNANRGREVMGQMVQAIDEISRSNAEIMAKVEAGNHEMGAIVKVIAEIAEKTKVINDIVFQTKLLSFNASVEAARAGEHGKGFAVVAEEVGNLAAMSGKAANEISSMLDDSQRKVETIVANTRTQVQSMVEVGREKVSQGTQIAERCSQVLEEIVSNASNVKRMVEEISAATMEQSKGVREINGAMTQLDQVTQANAAGSQQTASAASELFSQSGSLRNSVQELLRLVEGESNIHQARPSHASNAMNVFDVPKVVKTESRKKKPKSVVTSVNAAPLESNVVQLRAGARSDSDAPSRSEPQFTIPSENDPRFKDA